MDYQVAAPVRRKPVVKGIVAFALSMSGIAFDFLISIYGILGLTASLVDGGRDAEMVGIVFGAITLIFGVINLGMNIPAMIMSKSAIAVHAAAPERYTLLGMYKAGKVVSVINIVVSVICVVLAVVGMMA